MKVPTVANKLPVNWVSMQATVLASSRYGLEYDRLKVLHEIGLAQPLASDESFYVPPVGRAIDTRKVFPDGNITNFAGQRFQDLQDEIARYADALKAADVAVMDEMHELLKATAMLSPVIFKQGTHVLTFEYELALYPNAEQVFELALWAPMPSFEVSGRAQITATVMLPSSNNFAFNARVLEAVGHQPDAQGNPVTEVPKVLDSEYGLRHILVWNWQNDPLFRVKYQYQ